MKSAIIYLSTSKEFPPSVNIWKDDFFSSVKEINLNLFLDNYLLGK